MTDWLKRQHKSRCEDKPALPRASLADKLAEEASRRTGELIISYQCCDCGWWHIGHADESQIAAHIPPNKQSCLLCGKEIPESRINHARRSGFKTRACSRQCARKMRQQRKRQRRSAREQAHQENPGDPPQE